MIICKEKQRIIDLHDSVIGICISNLCTKWKNSWMWMLNPNIQTGKSVLTYHQLIYLYNDYTFHYNDINENSIEIEYDEYKKCYRIDIKTRYDIHNFWLFSDKEWLLVEMYVKKLIKSEYDAFQKFYSILNLTDGAYYNEILPEKMYSAMIVAQRKEKLEKLNK